VGAHFHLIMAMAGVLPSFPPTYFWFPKMFGRMMNESLGRWQFLDHSIGGVCHFMPMHLLGIAGHRAATPN